MERLLWMFYHLCRLLLGAVFVYAGWVKLSDVTAFASKVAAYQLLPYQWNYLIAVTLPYVEFFAGGLLLLNHRVRPAALLLALLTLGFIVALGTLLLRDLQIDCGCFGSASTSPQAALLKNFQLLVLAHFTFHLRNRFAAQPVNNQKN